jgi:outer membrane protein assembly factor BamB
MFSSNKKSRLNKIFLLLLLSSILLLAGCTRAPTRGWSGPLVSDNVLYVGSILGKVIALDLLEIEAKEPESEWVKWERPLESPGAGGFLACSTRVSTPMSTYGTPAIGEDKVYVGGYDGYIYSFRIDDGSMSKFDTGSAIVGSPIVADETVFVGNSDGKFYALNLDLSPKWPAPFETGDKIWSTPAVDNGVVYIGSSDHKLYAIDIESGREIWHFETQGAILSTPLVVEGTIYIGSCDNNLYAIDAATEEERRAAATREEGDSIPSREAKWVFDEAGNWFWTKALFYNDEIWVGCLDHKVYAINAQNPDDFRVVLETQGMVCTPPVLIDSLNLILIGSEDGNVYAIDPQEKSYDVLYSFEAPVLAPLYADQEKGILYVHAQNGSHMLYAIEMETRIEKWHYPG